MVSPDDEEPNRIELSETPIDPVELPSEPPPPVPRKRRSVFASLLSTLLLIVLLAGAALYAAIAFKDRDERLKAVADYAEPYVDQASGAFDELKNRLGALLGEKASTQTTAVAPEAPPKRVGARAARKLRPPPNPSTRPGKTRRNGRQANADRVAPRTPWRTPRSRRRTRPSRHCRVASMRPKH